MLFCMLCVVTFCQSVLLKRDDDDDDRLLALFIPFYHLSACTYQLVCITFYYSLLAAYSPLFYKSFSAKLTQHAGQTVACRDSCVDKLELRTSKQVSTSLYSTKTSQENQDAWS